MLFLVLRQLLQVSYLEFHGCKLVQGNLASYISVKPGWSWCYITLDLELLGGKENLVFFHNFFLHVFLSWNGKI